MSTDVRLRPLSYDDWPAVHAWASLPEACRYQTWGPSTEEETKAFVKAAVQAWEQSPQVRYVHAVEVDGVVVGNGELKILHRTHRQGEISYIVHPRMWGRGVGTAAGRELLRIGFEELDLHRIVGTCDPRNLGSAAVLRKLGMTYEGHLRHTQLIRDGWRDSLAFSILDDEWRLARDGD
ncbi:GNAT family protein [Actinopolymorpha sp. B11F2]|uniref:GNAT family N-acetyltransferase n=1 Tax=Actinopolymorpha sp. B11F2 TaxID=3160862 RepID=UPI0032E4241D